MKCQEKKCQKEGIYMAPLRILFDDRNKLWCKKHILELKEFKMHKELFKTTEKETFNFLYKGGIDKEYEKEALAAKIHEN